MHVVRYFLSKLSTPVEQVTWLVYIIGAIVGARTASSSGETYDILDGDLITRLVLPSVSAISSLFLCLSLTKSTFLFIAICLAANPANDQVSSPHVHDGQAGANGAPRQRVARPGYP